MGKEVEEDLVTVGDRRLDVLCLAMNLIEKLFGTWVLLFWLPIVVLAFGIAEWTAAFRRVWAPGQSD